MYELVILFAVALFAAFLTLWAARQWPGDRYLCDTCRFNNPEMCLKTDRPYALNCLAYREALSNERPKEPVRQSQ